MDEKELDISTSLASLKEYIATRKVVSDNSLRHSLFEVFVEAAQAGEERLSRRELLDLLNRKLDDRQVAMTTIAGAINQIGRWCVEWSALNPDKPQLCLKNGVIRLRHEFEKPALPIHRPSSGMFLDLGLTADDEMFIKKQITRLEKLNPGLRMDIKGYLEWLLSKALERERKHPR